MPLTRPTYPVNNVQSLDTIIKGQGTTVKQVFDKASDDIKSYLEALLIELESAGDGTSGADSLGIPETIVGSGSNIRDRADWLYTQIQGIALGAVPDKSLTEVKLADSLADLQIHYGVDTGVANAYVVTLDPVPTSYKEGMALAVKISADSTGASTINVNELGAKTIKGSDGLDIGAGDLKAGSIYTLRYNGVNFIVQGKGGVALTGTAQDTEVISGKTYYNTDAKTKRAGTMVNRGAVIITPTSTEQTIPVGYHNGLGKVTAMQGVIKGVQRGSVIMTSTSVDIPISTVDMNKSVVNVSYINEDGSTSLSLRQGAVGGLLTSTTNLNLSLPSYGSTFQPTVYWEVIEFQNIKSLQKGSVTISATPTSVAVSAVNTSKSLLFANFKHDTTGTSFAFSLLGKEIVSSTEIRFSASQVGKVVNWWLVELN